MTSWCVESRQLSQAVIFWSFFYLMTFVQGGPVYLPALPLASPDGDPESSVGPAIATIEDSGVEFLIDYDKNGEQQLTSSFNKDVKGEELLTKAEEVKKVQDLLDSALLDVGEPDEEEEEEEEEFDDRRSERVRAPVVLERRQMNGPLVRSPLFDKRQSGDYTIQNFQASQNDLRMADAADSDEDGDDDDERRTWRTAPVRQQSVRQLRPPLTRQNALDIPDEDAAQTEQEFYQDRSDDDDNDQSMWEDVAEDEEQEEEDAELEQIEAEIAQLRRQRKRRQQMKKVQQQMLDERKAQRVLESDQFLDEENADSEPTPPKKARGGIPARENAEQRMQRALRRLKREIDRKSPSVALSKVRSPSKTTSSVKKQKKKVKVPSDKKSHVRSQKQTVRKLRTVSLADARKSASSEVTVKNPARIKRQVYTDDKITDATFPIVFVTSADMEEPTELDFQAVDRYLDLKSDQTSPVPMQLMRRKRDVYAEENFDDGYNSNTEDLTDEKLDDRQLQRQQQQQVDSWDFDGVPNDEDLLAGIERPAKGELVDSSISGRFRVCKLVKEKFHKTLSFTGKTLEVDECLVTCERRVEQRTFSHIFKLVDWPCGSRLEGSCQKDGSCSAF